jgi:glucose/mannose-6-phosphate isomerase
MSTDSLGFVDAVRGLPEQLADAHEGAAALDPGALPRPDEIDHVVVCGMGGSGISGDVLAAVAGECLPCPVLAWKHYRLPGFVGPRSLVFAVSYSGGTEETVAMARDALGRGARVVAVTCGGALGELAAEHGAVHVRCPSGYQPRAALGALVAPLFVALYRMGMLPEAHAWLVKAQEQLARRRDACAPEVTGPANPARELARHIDRTVPLVYGGGPLGGVAAYRWKCDVNENAKAPALWNVYPELDHNEICGWGQHGDVTRQIVSIVELRHGFEPPEVGARFAATRDIVGETVHQVLEVEAEGEGELAQLLDLMYLGDWTSCYLALDSDVDPGPIPAIADLKARLAR